MAQLDEVVKLKGWIAAIKKSDANSARRGENGNGR
jgi:hypothetical protein